jgi:stage V sporulation protein S
MVMTDGANTLEGDQGNGNQVIFVRPSSNVQGVGSQVLSGLRAYRRITLRAIGAGAVNQALKGAIQARQQFAANGEDLIIRPGFVTVDGNDGYEVTAIVLHCMLG